MKTIKTHQEWSDTYRAIAKLAADQIVLDFPQAEVVLFGSVRSGHATRNSDIDLAVFLPDDLIQSAGGDMRLAGRIRGNLGEFMVRHDAPIDVIVFAQSRRYTPKEKRSSILAEVLSNE